MKRLVVRTVLCSLLCLSLIGCGNTGNEIASEMGNELGQQLVQDYKESTGDYVYDYQVSMEPIPKEIADLGGPCQGTIHAFPSKIEMALTEQKMEEDPELKAEVEKRKVEVEQYLEAEIGKDFSIDGVIVNDDLYWHWICAEADTGHQFALTYCNYQYSSMKLWGDEDGGENVIYIDDYLAKEDTLKYAPALNTLVEEIYDESFNDVSVKISMYGGMSGRISIIQYTDEEIDRQSEQVKILDLWEKMQNQYDDMHYEIAWIYCPSTYKTLMEEKYSSGLYIDDMYTNTFEKILMYVEGGELIDYISYDSTFDKTDDMSLDILLQEYQNGTYDESEIWPYWVSQR